MRTIEVRIRGMDCQECATGLEKSLKRLNGVKSCRVHFISGKAVIVFDEAMLSEEEIVASIRARGFAPSLAKEELPSGRRYAPHLAVLAVLALFPLLILIDIVLGIGGAGHYIAKVPRPFFLLILFLGGYPIVKNALFQLFRKNITTDLIITIAMVSALFVGEFSSALLILFFVRLAHFWEEFVVDKSRSAIQQLMDISPKTCRIQRRTGEEIVDISQVKKGDVAIIKSGDTIAVDGVVLSGSASVNQAPITGESIPVEKNRGDQVFAGSINEQGVLTVEVVHIGDDTTLGKIIRLVEEAESAKAPVQRFADRFSSYFLPMIVGIALLTFFISGKASSAIAILLVGCPCSIALATPLAVVMSIGRNAKEGLLIKGGKYLELLAKSNLLFLDKTGTLTFGRPEITDCISFGSFSEERILFLAASAEKLSEHILAKAFLRKVEEKDISILSPSHFIVYPGMGIQAEVDRSVVLLGNRRLMKTNEIVLLESHEAKAAEWEDQGKTVVFLACNGRLEAIVAAQDTIRHGVRESLQRLASLGMNRIIMITGDNTATAEYIAKNLQIKYRANLLPQDKIAIVREYQKKGYIVTMIGDGINDAPALVAADVGIAMGVAGTSIAIESADIALMGDEWRKIPEAIISARRAFFTIRQNIGFSILFNIIGIGLAAIGFLSPLVAAMAHSLPDIAVFLNSARLLKKE